MIDAQGVGHATFSRFNGEAAYARYEAGEWTAETALSGGIPGMGIALDAEGAVHFAAGKFVPDGDDQALVHVTNAGGDWSAEDIGIGYQGLAFALGPDDMPVVAHGGPHGELVVRAAAGGWTEELVDAETFSCCYSFALTVAPDGTRHVAYVADAEHGELRYATDASGQWVTLTMGSSDLATVGGLSPSLVVESASRAHVAYERPGLVVVATVQDGVVVDETPHELGWAADTIAGFTFELPDVVHLARFTAAGDALIVEYGTDRGGQWSSSRVGEYVTAFDAPLVVVDRWSSPWLLYTAGVSAIEMQSVVAAAPDGHWCR